MCNLLTNSVEEKIQGYKVVARKPRGKRYYSIAMGFKYPLDGHIPVVRRQRKICADFAEDITSKRAFGYRKSMIGRTSVFLSLDELSKSIQFRRWKSDFKNKYKLIIVRVVVSGDTMEGFYGKCKVAAGRYIHFMEEVTKNV